MTKRLGPKEEGYFQDIFDHQGGSAPMLFGRYLKMKGLISDEDIFNARMIQKNQNRKIGEMAVERGWLSPEDVERLLVYQEETGRKFGELAVLTGMISEEQLAELLGQIEGSYIFFGQALVNLGIMKSEEMMDNLKTFQRLKLGQQTMDS